MDHVEIIQNIEKLLSSETDPLKQVTNRRVLKNLLQQFYAIKQEWTKQEANLIEVIKGVNK